MTISKRILAGFLSFAMVCSFAGLLTNTAVHAEEVEELQTEQTEQTEYTSAEAQTEGTTALEVEYTVSLRENALELADAELTAKEEAERIAREEAERKAAEEKAAQEEAARKAAEAQQASNNQSSTVTLSASASTSGSSYQDGLAAYILSVNSSVGSSTALYEAAAFIQWGNYYGIRPELLMAMAQVESTFNPNCGGGTYYGLMQMTASIGSKYAGVSGSGLYDANTNVHAGAGYLAALISYYNGDTVKGISAYVYGSGNVNNGNYSTSIANYRIGLANSISSYLSANGYV